MQILIPDAQFRGPAEIEQAAAPGLAFRPFHGTPQGEIPEAEWAAADAVVCYHEVAFDRAWLERLPRCRTIVRAGVGFDNIDLRAAGEMGIPVCNVPDYGTTDVADHAIAMMLDLTRGVSSYDRLLRADPRGNWRFDAPPAITRLRGRTFGAVGLGRIGTAAARRARAFDMEVVFYDPYLPMGTELALGFRRLPSLGALMAEADVVSLHAPLTPETRGMIDAAALSAAKPGQVLVNTARGPMIDLDALHAAMRESRVKAAGLDVIPEEPTDATHPLLAAWRADEEWIRDRLLLSPHAAFYSPDSIVDLRRKSAEVVQASLFGPRRLNCVNEAFLKTPRG
jgi:lactate dehydrogenase-like 2-hydroxyacid dehydrogenase